MNQHTSAAPGDRAPRLQVGGTLVPGRDIYIARPEDEQLFELLREGEYVNILSSRQVGKSSLMLRTAFRLRDELGYRFAVVDLTSLGTPENAQAYFRGLVGEIARQLKLNFDAQTFWREDAGAGTNTQQFIRFFREVVATEIDGPVLIFLDEIDSTLKLPYTDDLFTALRSMYNERALVPAYQRIAFCLVGVATPDELIKDRRTTPYNVGRTLWLGDFDAARDDLSPLIEVLSDNSQRGQTVLSRVLNWTGGHPFLTTRLCQDLRSDGITTPEDVDRFVTERYATLDRLGEDVHIQQILRFVRERLSDGLASFNLYERILKGAKERDQPSLAHAELKLSGLVKRDGNGFLVPRNRIYERLFDLQWVQKSRPRQEVRRYRRFAVAAGVLLMVSVIGGLSYYQLRVVPLQTQEGARKALQNLGVTLTTNKVYGWADVGLPEQRKLEILRQALPSLVALSKAPDGLALDLADTGLTNADLRRLAEVSGLRALDISDNRDVTDLGPLGDLARLESLDISGTQVTDLSPLSRLTDLRRLNVSSTPVSDVAPVAGLRQLEELNLSRTKVKDLSPLEGLTTLRMLALDGLGITGFNADGRIRDLKVLQDPVRSKPGPAGEAFRDCPECPQMVVVPADSFVMGSPASEVGRGDDEGPQHTVKITQPFAVGKYEVRFDEWMLCVQDGVCKAPSDEGWGRGPRPVINVSWDDAQQYVAWLTKKSGQPYRLLSEAEWEYAARAGTTASRYWGDGEEGACAYASVYDKRGKETYRFNWDNFTCDDGYAATAPVGMFQPNNFGLHDMLGNVWEWTEDCYQPSYNGGPSDGSAWVTEDSRSRVVRGGGWDFGPRLVRSAFRYGYFADFRFDVLGFRVARTLTP